VDANASLSTTKEALRPVGPLAGAGIYTAVGGAGVAVLDAASFLVAGLTVLLLAVPDPVPERHPGRWRVEVMAGVNHIRNEPVLRPTILAVAASLLVVGFTESAVFAMVDAFGRPASFVGVIIAVQGIGAITGGLVAARIVRARGEPWAVTWSLATVALGLAICASVPLLSVVFVGIAVFGCALTVFVVAFSTLLQRRTPQRLMGRVSTASDVLLGTPQALSIAAGAVIVGLLSYRTIFWICAVVVIAAAGNLARELRAESRRRTLPPAALSPLDDPDGDRARSSSDPRTVD
jgi:MFS family permease